MNYLLYFIRGCLFFVTSSVCAQGYPQTPSHILQGYTLEAEFGSIVCTLNKPVGFPVSYVVRTNRPDIFFSVVDDVGRCLFQLMKQRNKRDDKKIVYALIQPAQPSSFWFGEFGNVLCTKIQNEKGMPLSYEFSFPYLEKKDISHVASEVVLQGCLEKMTPFVQVIKPPTKDYEVL